MGRDDLCRPKNLTDDKVAAGLPAHHDVAIISANVSIVVPEYYSGPSSPNPTMKK
jgi:hypothetical protein